MTGDGRIGLAAAVAFAALYLLSGLVVAAPPAPDAPAAEIQRYFVNHADALATSAWLIVAATVPFLVFAAVLRRRLADAAGWLGDLAFGGGLVLAAAGVGTLMISLGLALHPDFNPPETVRILVDVQRFFAPPGHRRGVRARPRGGARFAAPRRAARMGRGGQPVVRGLRAARELHRVRRRQRRVCSGRVGEPRRDARLPAVGRRRRGGTYASLSSRGCPRRPPTS